MEIQLSGTRRRIRTLQKVMFKRRGPKQRRGVPAPSSAAMMRMRSMKSKRAKMSKSIKMSRAQRLCLRRASASIRLPLLLPKLQREFPRLSKARRAPAVLRQKLVKFEHILRKFTNDYIINNFRLKCLPRVSATRSKVQRHRLGRNILLICLLPQLLL